MVFGGSGRKVMVIAVVGVIVLVVIIFSIPFNIVPYRTIEIYQDIEMKQEPYVDTESYVSLEICEREEPVYDGTPYSVPEGISAPFSVTQADTRLVGRFELPAPGGFYVYSSAGKIVYEQLGTQGNVDIYLPKGDYKALLRERVSWEERVSLNLKLQWTELCEVTRHREVTKYREVPVTVEKQRTVTECKKVSLWEVIF